MGEVRRDDVRKFTLSIWNGSFDSSQGLNAPEAKDLPPVYISESRLNNDDPFHSRATFK